MCKIYLLVALIAVQTSAFAQDTLYGNNPSAGHYVKVGDASLYYEIYGKGEPLVMLHGGIYGYIDEFAAFISRLSKQYQVICIATRGHGKSEIGKEPFSYKQRAQDAFAVIRSITQDSVTVIGFSDGGFTALKLAASYPAVVKRLVAIGVNDKPSGGSNHRFDYNATTLMRQDSAFFASRLKLMPEPDRWDEMLQKATTMYNNDYMSAETFSLIRCPALIMSGDRDNYNTNKSVVQCAEYIKGSQLSIIPGCAHVVFFCNFPAVWESLRPFLGIK